jgi:hypothetical protein
MHKLMSVNYNNRAIHCLSVLSLIKTLIISKGWLYKTRVTRDTSHIQNVYKMDGPSKSDTFTTKCEGPHIGESMSSQT